MVYESVVTTLTQLTTAHKRRLAGGVEVNPKTEEGRWGTNAQFLRTPHALTGNRKAPRVATQEENASSFDLISCGAWNSDVRKKRSKLSPDGLTLEEELS